MTVITLSEAFSFQKRNVNTEIHNKNMACLKDDMKKAVAYFVTLQNILDKSAETPKTCPPIDLSQEIQLEIPEFQKIASKIKEILPTEPTVEPKGIFDKFSGFVKNNMVKVQNWFSSFHL
jgi:hypothetical protein